MTNSAMLQELTYRLVHLQDELDDLLKRWPAHSVKPELIILRENLEEEIAELKVQIARII